MRWATPARTPKWRRWFAWYPVRVNGSGVVVWLETVERFDFSCEIGGYTDYRLMPPHDIPTK